MSDALAKQESNLVQFDQAKVLEYLKLDPSKIEVQALIVACNRYGLDPLLRHAVLIDGKLYVTRDGLLHVAHSTGQLDGIEVLEQSDWDTHYAAKVAVHRKDMSHPFTYVGRFPKIRGVHEWRTDQSGKRFKKHIRDEIHPYGPEMAVKCGEVMALRRAFDVSLAAQEEMWDTPEVYEAKVVKQDEVEAEGSPSTNSEAPASSDEGSEEKLPDSAETPAPEGTAASPSSDSSLLTQAQNNLEKLVKGARSQAAMVTSFMGNKGKSKQAGLESLSEQELVEFMDFVQKAKGSR